METKMLQLQNLIDNCKSEEVMIEELHDALDELLQQVGTDYKNGLNRKEEVVMRSTVSAGNSILVAKNADWRFGIDEIGQIVVKEQK